MALAAGPPDVAYRHGEPSGADGPGSRVSPEGLLIDDRLCGCWDDGGGRSMSTSSRDEQCPGWIRPVREVARRRRDNGWSKSRESTLLSGGEGRVEGRQTDRENSSILQDNAPERVGLPTKNDLDRNWQP